MYSGKVPVMASRHGTCYVLKQANSQTVISTSSQLSCHPVRQTCIGVLRRLMTQWLIKVDGLEIKMIKLEKIKLNR